MWDRRPLTEARILIVDDRETDTRLLGRILRRGGYTNITTLMDSREFSSTFLDLQPDLILLDLTMPHLDGLAILRLLRSHLPEGTYLPVLVLTAEDTTEAMWESFSHGAKDFVTKPYNWAEVLLRVKNLLETRDLYLQLVDKNPIREREAASSGDDGRAASPLT